MNRIAQVLSYNNTYFEYRLSLLGNFLRIHFLYMFLVVFLSSLLRLTRSRLLDVKELLGFLLLNHQLPLVPLQNYTLLFLSSLVLRLLRNYLSLPQSLLHRYVFLHLVLVCREFLVLVLYLVRYPHYPTLDSIILGECSRQTTRHIRGVPLHQELQILVLLLHYTQEALTLQELPLLKLSLSLLQLLLHLQIPHRLRCNPGLPLMLLLLPIQKNR